MTGITVSSNNLLANWETSSINTVQVGGKTLEGMAAVAYLFGRALASVEPTRFGAAGQLRISRSDAAFEFPAGSAQRVSLQDIADAIRYKYGKDPLIEFSGGMGLSGYSLADLNDILGRLNSEFAGQFRIEPLSTDILATTLTVTQEGASDLLLRDLLDDTQRAALVTLARQLKTVVAPSGDPLQQLLASAADDQGLDLSASTAAKIPGSTTVSALINQAQTTLGLDFSARLPDLFQGGKLRVADVNVLLAAAREADPSQANDLGDVTVNGISRGGVTYTGRQAVMLSVADTLLGLEAARLSGTRPPQIGWAEQVFADPFSTATPPAKLSLNDLATRFGFGPFDYLGTGVNKPAYLTLAEINGFLTQLNTTLNLSGSTAFSPLKFQYKDDYGTNIPASQAYLNQLAHSLASAGGTATAGSTPLTGVWSADYASTLSSQTIGDGSIADIGSGAYWVWSPNEASNTVAYNGTGPFDATLQAAIPSRQTGVVYVRMLQTGQPAAFTWDGAAFQRVTTVNGLTVNNANIRAICNYWQSQGQVLDGVQQWGMQNLTEYAAGFPASYGNSLIAAPVSLYAPYVLASRYQMPGGQWLLDYGEPVGEVDAARAAVAYVGAAEATAALAGAAVGAAAVYTVPTITAFAVSPDLNPGPYNEIWVRVSDPAMLDTVQSLLNGTDPDAPLKLGFGEPLRYVTGSGYGPYMYQWSRTVSNGIHAPQGEVVLYRLLWTDGTQSVPSAGRVTVADDQLAKTYYRIRTGGTDANPVYADKEMTWANLRADGLIDDAGRVASSLKGWSGPLTDYGSGAANSVSHTGLSAATAALSSATAGTAAAFALGAVTNNLATFNANGGLYYRFFDGASDASWLAGDWNYTLEMRLSGLDSASADAFLAYLNSGANGEPPGGAIRLSGLNPFSVGSWTERTPPYWSRVDMGAGVYAFQMGVTSKPNVQTAVQAVRFSNSSYLYALKTATGLMVKPLTQTELMQDQLLDPANNVTSRVLGFSGSVAPPLRLTNSRSLSAAIFEYPPGSGIKLTLSQLSAAMARDFAGSASAGTDADQGLNLVDWFMGTGAAYSGTVTGWPAGYARPDAAALAYTQPGGSLQTIGLGAWNDPSGNKPLSEWSIKAAMFSLWWSFNTKAVATGSSSKAWDQAMQPVVSGAAQLGVAASAAVSAQSVLATPLASQAVAGSTQSLVVATLSGSQLTAFQQAVRNTSPADLSGNLTDELAEMRRALQRRAQPARTGLESLSAAERSSLGTALRGAQSALLDAGLLQRFALGQRIGFEEPCLRNAQGEPASLASLLGGRSSALAQKVQTAFPALAELGLGLDDLRRLLAAASGGGVEASLAELDDPARMRLADGSSYVEGGAAVLLRVARALRSVANGAYASVPLAPDARVFDDPITPGSGTQWSLNDLSLLCQRSAGVPALASAAASYDTDLDAMVRLLEQTARGSSQVSLSSQALSDAGIAWFANQLVLAPGASISDALLDANAAVFGTSTPKKSFLDLLATFQRVFGQELAPRLEAMGVLRAGSRVNPVALNALLAWARARDASVLAPALTLSGNAASLPAGSLTSAAYLAAATASRTVEPELVALGQVLRPWSSNPAAGTLADWRAAQARLADATARAASANALVRPVGLQARLAALAAASTDPASSSTLAKEVKDVLIWLDQTLSKATEAADTLFQQVDATQLDTGLLTRSWNFASDNATRQAAWASALAVNDAQCKQLRQAWRSVRIVGGSQALSGAIARDANGNWQTGVAAQGVLLAQALSSLEGKPTASQVVDPDAALFEDPARWGSAALRQAAAGSGAPRISLRLLGQRFEAALGFNPISTYTPQGGWTVAHLNGLVGALGGALGVSVGTGYAGVTGVPVVGTSALKTRLLGAATQELVIPSALRAPLTTLINRLSEVSAADLQAASAIDDSAGVFDVNSLLFDSAPGVASPDRSFAQLLAAGNNLSPSLSQLLTSLGILTNGKVDIRGLNRLRDVLAVELGTQITAGPVPQSAILANRVGTVSLDEFEVLRNANSATREVLDQFQALVDEWKARELSVADAASEFPAWRNRVQAVLDQASANRVDVPIDAASLRALLSLQSAPVPTRPPTGWLKSLKERVQAVISDVQLTIAQMNAARSNYAAGSADDLAITRQINTLTATRLLPFQNAANVADAMLAEYAAGRDYANTKTNVLTPYFATQVSYPTPNALGVSSSGLGLLQLTDGQSVQTLNLQSSYPDLLLWLSQYDVPTSWLNNPAHRDMANPYAANGVANFGAWLTKGYPGAARSEQSVEGLWYDSSQSTKEATGVFSFFIEKLTSAKAQTAPTGLPAPRFGWEEMAERLMTRSQSLQFGSGQAALWYQVGSALAQVEASDLPADGSGAQQSLFEYPPGSGMRYNLATLARMIDVQGSAGVRPSVNQTLNSAIHQSLRAGGSPADIADRLRSQIAALKASGQASGDVLGQLTSGVFSDADADRSAVSGRSRPLESSQTVDQIGYLSALLERNSLSEQHTRGLVQELLTRMKDIYAGSGSDVAKLASLASALQGLQSRPLDRGGLGSGSISDLLAVATRGQFNRSDLLAPTDPQALRRLDNADNRAALIQSLQAYLDQNPVVDTSYQLLAQLGEQVNTASFTAADRDRLLAAIGQAYPEVARALAGRTQPQLSASEQSRVQTLAAAVASDQTQLTTTVTRKSLPPLTQLELRTALTEGGDIYVDRQGGYYIQGQRTRPVDLAVTTRLLAQDQYSGEYKSLMDDMNERNNYIAAARGITSTLDQIASGSFSNTSDTYRTAAAGVLSAIGSVTGTDAMKANALVNVIATLKAGLGLSAGDNLLGLLTGGVYTSVSFGAGGNSSAVSDVLTKYIKRADLLSTVDSWSSALGEDALSALTSGQYNVNALGGPGYSVSTLSTYLGSVKTRAQALRADLNDRRNEAQLRMSRYLSLQAANNGRNYSGAMATASATYTRISSWLVEIDNGIAAMSSLQSAAGQGASAFAQSLAANKTTYNKTDLFAWIRSFDVPASRLTSQPYNQMTLQLNFTQVPSYISVADGGVSAQYLYVNRLVNAGLPALHSPTTGYAEKTYNLDWSNNTLGVPDNQSFIRTTSSLFGSVTTVLTNLSALTSTDLARFEPDLKSVRDYVLDALQTAESSYTSFDWNSWKTSGLSGAATGYSDAALSNVVAFDDLMDVAAKTEELKSQLNTLISNKIRDGDLAQQKLQQVTAQLQNNVEAMSALIKTFSDITSTMARALA